MRILLVEDELNIAKYIKNGLERHNYAVDLAYTGIEALAFVGTGPTEPLVPYDLYIVDIVLPEMDGLAVCRNLRARDIREPILILTARDEIEDRVAGLDAGADDYLGKPFAMEELLARLRALSRRALQAPKTTLLQVADLSLDTVTQKVKRAGHLIELTAKEYAVLECLMREPDRLFSQSNIAEHVWSYEADNQSNVVEVYIRNLRRKIDDPCEIKLIHTIRGSGYRLSAGG
jgi:DNA-binding response OmpR family regulator